MTTSRPVGRGDCPACGRSDAHHEVIGTEERQSYELLDSDPGAAALLEAALGHVDWPTALDAARRSKRESFAVAGRTERTARSRCKRCGATIEWATWTTCGDVVELRNPTHWSLTARH